MPISSVFNAISLRYFKLHVGLDVIFNSRKVKEE